MKRQILNAIAQYDTIIIHRHVRPDPDAIGSQGGLSEMIKTTYPDKKVYVVGSEEASLVFLNHMDDISDHIYESALVIVCDTANAPRIDDNRYNKGDKLIKIDHHPNEDPFGDIVWVDTTASSVSEMIYDLYEYGLDDSNGLVLTTEAARLLYAGIVGDTGRFLFDNTTEKTFRIAGELRAYSFSITNLCQELYKVQLNIVRLNGYVLNHFEITESGAASIRLDTKVLKKYQVTANETSQLVHAFSDVEGIKAWVFFIEEPEEIRVRLRSKGPVINEIAKKYDGGGHPLAAGARVHTWEEADQVLQDLEKACRKFS